MRNNGKIPRAGKRRTRFRKINLKFSKFVLKYSQKAYNNSEYKNLKIKKR